jgi:hypothetical protein
VQIEVQQRAAVVRICQLLALPEEQQLVQWHLELTAGVWCLGSVLGTERGRMSYAGREELARLGAAVG